MSDKLITTTIRFPKELYELLYKEVKWAEKMPVNQIIIEALNSWLAERGYK